VLVPVHLHTPRGLCNPGAPDLARAAAARGVVAVGGVASSAAIVRQADAPVDSGARRWLAALRQRAVDGLRYILVPHDLALVGALAFGERGAVDDAREDRFRRAGVSHVLSVSGLHLSLVAALAFALVRRALLRVPRLARGQPPARWAALVAIAVAVGYTLMTGAEVATVRALVVAAVHLGGFVVGRRARLVESLALAALAILMASPLTLFDPSFQLSLAATVAMAVWLRPLPPVEPAVSFGWLRALWRWARSLVAASVAATIATAPLTAWHFSEVQPAGILTNLAVVPLAELTVVPVGLFAGLLSSLSTAVGRPPALLAGFAAAELERLVAWCATWSPSWQVPRPSAFEAVALAAALVAIAVWRRSTAATLRRRAATVALACVVVCGLSAAGRAAIARLFPSLHVTFVDVGQGDSALLELPGGHAVVIDAGGSFDTRFDPGRTALLPLFVRRGVTRVDVVVLTHPHPDHANGLAAVLDSAQVGEVWTNGAVTTQPGTLALLDAARRQGVPVVRPHAVELNGVRITPIGSTVADPRLSENDNSTVLLVEYAGRRLLFLGDVERRREAMLLSELGPVDVVKVPHHGSRTSSTAGLLGVIRPRIAVASVGQDNRWNFPHPDVAARYRAAGAAFYRTDRDGAVVVEVGSRGGLEVFTTCKPP
jgi:competence protein ComEC